jgi:hypothetical protein
MLPHKVEKDAPVHLAGGVAGRSLESAGIDLPHAGATYMMIVR